MQGLTEAGTQMVSAMAARHNVSTDAVYHLLMALSAGGGTQAQFNHPELGGMGQWSQGGMIMVGDMFNQSLKYRVDGLCNDLAGALYAQSPFAPVPHYAPQQQSHQSQSQGGQSQGGQSQGGGFGFGGSSLFVAGGGFGSRWPAHLGSPSSSGSQNNLHYAVFPQARRLAVDVNGQITLFDLGDHQISGFSQQQSGDQSVSFISQHGLVRLADLPVVSAEAPVGVAPVAPEPAHQAPPASQAEAPQPVFIPAPAPVLPPVLAPAVPLAMGDDEIFSRIERLADLRKKDILTEEEFAAKKAELLARL